MRKELDHEIYSTRMLVFVETEPQSNKYHQIYLTREQFKKVSDAICKIVSKKGDEEVVEFQQSVETFELPDLKEINT